MSSFGTGTTTTGGSSIVLTAFTGTNGAQAGTDGLVPGPAVNQAGYILGAGGDWTLSILGGIPLNESSDRIATTEFVQDVVGNAVLGGNAQLSQLTDVTIAGLADDQFLQYNVGSGKWENTTLTLSLISDVNLAGLVDGNALVYDANAGQWVPGQGGGGGAANLNDLGDVTIAGGAEFHFLVRNAQGQYVNRLISTADLSNSANIALLNQAQTFSGNVTFTADVDLIGATVDATTQPANDNSTLVATTEYTDRQVSDSITALNLGTASQSNVGDFLASGSNLTDLGDVTVNGAVAEHFIVSDAQGNFTNRTISTSDLSDDANIALLNANQTFIGTVRTTTQALDDDSTKLATTAYVTAQFSSDISTTSISDLADVHSLVGIQNGNVLAWVAGNNRFEFTAPAQTYTDENARDAVGTALEGGAHTGISFSNNDNADTIEATVTLGGFSVGDLSDVDLAGVVNGKILKYSNGSFEVADETDTNTQLSDEQVQDIVGPMFTANNAGNTGITFSYDDTEGVNDGTVTATVSIASTDLTDTANVARLNAVQTFSANNTFTADVDLTGANATASTQNASDNSTKLATTAYVDAQIDTDITALNLANTYQAKDASLDTITGIADGDLLLGNGADSFEKVSLQLGVENFLKSTARIAALSDVSLNGDELVNANHFLVSTGNGGFANQTISTSNLSDDASIALTTRATTFGAFAYNFEASTLTSATPALATDDTTVATTEWVNDVMNQAGNISALDDLNDVLLANVADAQIIVYDSDGGADDNQWKNVSLSGDVSITNAGVATIANDAITTDKILNGQVSNAKLADSEITVGSTAISLGATSTTLSGMTEIDFTNADATIGGSMTTNLGNPTTLTLGGLGSKVIISGDLQVQGDTTTVNTATLDIEDTIIRLNKGVDGGANPNDIGLFFERGTTGNDAVFFFDESTDTFKLGLTTDAHTTTEFNDANLTLSPLRVESPAGGDNSTLVATTAWVLNELPEELNDLTDVTIANPVEGHFLVRNGAGVFVNRTASSSDLSDTANIALLDANQTFTGTVSADTQALNDNSTKLATTAFVQNEITDLDLANTYQGLDDTLTALAGVNTVADKLIYASGVDTFSTTDLSAFGRSLIDDANSATARTTLGLEIGNNVQAYDDTLQSISALGTGADKLAYTTGVDTWAEAALSAFGRSLIDDADSATARTTLGLTSTATTALADLLQSANSLSEISDAGNEAVARGNLGLGSVSTLDTTVNGGNGENGKAVVTDGGGKLGALDGSNLTALGSIATHSDVDLTNIQNNQVLVYNANNSQFEPGSIPTSGTDVGQSPVITSQSISLNPNALVGGDLVIYGRVMEVIDYGSVANAFGAGDFAIDFGSVTDTKLYCADDYGVLVV